MRPIQEAFPMVKRIPAAIAIATVAVLSALACWFDSRVIHRTVIAVHDDLFKNIYRLVTTTADALEKASFPSDAGCIAIALISLAFVVWWPPRKAG
jgi:hypothetical protein